LRRGAKIVQKAGDAIIQGISLRAQQQTRQHVNRIDTLGTWSRLGSQVECGSILTLL
jgi:hypothetical protein